MNTLLVRMSVIQFNVSSTQSLMSSFNPMGQDGNTPLEFAEIYRQTEIRDLLLRTRDERVLHGSLLRLIQVMMSKAWEQWQVSYDEMKDFNAVMFRIAARVKNKSLCRSWEIWYAPIRRIHSKKNKKEADQIELSRQRSMARREADQAEAAGVTLPFVLTCDWPICCFRWMWSWQHLKEMQLLWS